MNDIGIPNEYKFSVGAFIKGRKLVLFSIYSPEEGFVI